MQRQPESGPTKLAKKTGSVVHYPKVMLEILDCVVSGRLVASNTFIDNGLKRNHLI
jgi:hypothetical protein